MTLYVLPALFALFVWWFSTGAIMFLDGLPRRTFRWSMLGASIVLLASLWGLHACADDTTVRGAYWAFTCGLLAWGWQEISFYMGFVTGPRSQPCPDGCSGWKHFGHAIQTSLWHELAIIAAALAVVALTWDAPNQVGTWTFMVLWWMHQSAKLNVFLGVRNLNEEFLPEHLQFLRSFLTRKPMNLLFPVSITVSTVILVRLVQAAIAPGASAFDAAGFCFLSTLMALAVLEHWLLVLPLPAAALWGWSLTSRKTRPTAPFDAEVVSGFLGAGKTTLLRARLAEAGPRTVVLVNDFAAIGVDGSLLRGRGADVVELPNGCICCSLRQDLSTQLREMVALHAPERVLIEPSGVADLASLLSVLQGPSLQPLLRSLAVTTVLDAGSFGRDHARLGPAIEAQVRLASSLVVNKADLATPAALRTIEGTLRSLNPLAPILPATFGIAAPALQPDLLVLAAAPLAAALPPAPTAAPPSQPLSAARVLPSAPPPVAGSCGGAVDSRSCDPHDHAHHDHCSQAHEPGDHLHRHADPLPAPIRRSAGAGQVSPADAWAHGKHDMHGHAGHGPHDPGFESWSAELSGVLDPDQLLSLLGRVAAGSFGAVERLKGVAPGTDGWLRFDVSGGRPFLAAFAAAPGEQARTIAIGRGLDEAGLAEAFAGCREAAPADSLLPELA